MNLWLGECRKLYQNKIFLMTLALLLTVSGLLCLRMPYERRYGEQREQIDAYLAEYQVSGAAFEAAVRSRVQTVDEYQNSADSRDSSAESEMPDEVRVAYDTYLADVMFIRFLDSTRKYEPTLEATIETARGQYYNYLQSGRQEDDFIVRYQVGMVNHYTRQLQKNISIPAEIVDGWDVILKDQGYLPFYLASLLILGALLLLPEKSAMLPLLRSTKRGRLPLILAKLLVGAAGAVVLLLSFALLHGLLIASRTGLGGALLPIQCVFVTAPFACSVIEGVLMQLALRALAGIGLVWLMLLISIFTKRYVSLLGIGGGIVAASYGLSLLGRWNAHGPIGQLNLLDIMQTSDFLTRWNAFRVGKACVVLQKMLIPWLVGIAAVMFAVSCVVFCRCRVVGRAQSTAWMRLREVAQRRYESFARRTNKKSRRYPIGIDAWERHKLIFQRVFFLLLLLLLIGQYYAIDTRYAPNETFIDGMYQEYMTLLEGEYSEQTQLAMQAQKDKLRAATAAMSEAQTRYDNGEISREEYSNLIKAGNLATQRLQNMAVVDEKLFYLHTLHAEGKTPYVLYDTGWMLFLQDSEDVALIAFLILVLASMFADEHTGGFSQILYSTPHGRRRTFVAKITQTVIFTAVLTLLTQAVRWGMLMKNYDLPALHAPAYSLMEQSTLNGSILQVTLATVALRTVGMILLALLVVTLSALFRSVFPTVILSAIVMFSSRILTLFDEDALTWLFPNHYLAGFPLLADHNIVPLAIGYALAVILLFALAAWRERCFET